MQAFVMSRAGSEFVTRTKSSVLYEVVRELPPLIDLFLWLQGKIPDAIVGIGNRLVNKRKLSQVL